MLNELDEEDMSPKKELTSKLEYKAFSNDNDDKQIIETKEEEIESPEPGGPVLDPAYAQSAIDNR